jgi:colanic acid biosynthesis glycosyl transferase WcaI
MLCRLQQKGVAESRAQLFPNWVDASSIFPLCVPQSSLRSIFDLPEDKVIVLYSGNMGKKQGLEILVDAARELQYCAEILFVLCGEGAAREDLQLAAHDLDSVRFLPLQPEEKLNEFLNSADIHVLPQRADAADLVMPSKLLGMLASGKPVIATAKPDTEVGKVVGQVGITIMPGDVRALCEAILSLIGSPEMRSSLGAKGRAYVCRNWRAELVLANLCTTMESAIHEN